MDTNSTSTNISVFLGRPCIYIFYEYFYLLRREQRLLTSLFCSQCHSTVQPMQVKDPQRGSNLKVRDRIRIWFSSENSSYALRLKLSWDIVQSNETVGWYYFLKRLCYLVVKIARWEQYLCQSFNFLISGRIYLMPRPSLQAKTTTTLYAEGYSAQSWKVLSSVSPSDSVYCLKLLCLKLGYFLRCTFYIHLFVSTPFGWTSLIKSPQSIWLYNYTIMFCIKLQGMLGSF